jgi:hypothetical protein
MGEENPGSHQTHRRRKHFEHRSRPLRPRARTPNDASPYTVKKISRTRRTKPPGGDLVQHVFQNRAVTVAGVAQKQRSSNHRKVHPISAAFRLRYLQALMRRWAASDAEMTGIALKVGM